MYIHTCTYIQYKHNYTYIHIMTDSLTSNPLAEGSNSTVVPCSTTLMTNPGNNPFKSCPYKK